MLYGVGKRVTTNVQYVYDLTMLCCVQLIQYEDVGAANGP